MDIDEDEVGTCHDSRTAFLEAVDEGDLPLVQALAAAGANIHARRIDYGCQSALATGGGMVSGAGHASASGVGAAAEVCPQWTRNGL